MLSCKGTGFSQQSDTRTSMQCLHTAKLTDVQTQRQYHSVESHCAVRQLICTFHMPSTVVYTNDRAVVYVA